MGIAEGERVVSVAREKQAVAGLEPGPRGEEKGGEQQDTGRSAGHAWVRACPSC